MRFEAEDVLPRRARMALPGVFIAAVLSAGRILADEPPPVACDGEEQCRALHEACERLYRPSDCSELHLTPGVVLAPRDACYAHIASQRCGRYDKALAQCLFAGGPGIAGGCWHLSPGFPTDVVEVNHRRIVCDQEWSRFSACDKLGASSSSKSGLRETE